MLKIAAKFMLVLGSEESDMEMECERLQVGGVYISLAVGSQQFRQ